MDEMFGNDSNDENEIKTEQNVASFLNQRPAHLGVICFHNGTEESMLSYVEQNAKENEPQDIINTIDKFCYSRHWMMNIGDQKSVFLLDAIKTAKKTFKNPLICLEVGSYCGYSTVLIANQLEEGDKIYSIEYNINCVEWTNRLLKYAGLSHRVEVFHGSLSNEKTVETLKLSIKNDYGINTHIGLVFIDHEKSLYLQDLQIIISTGLLKSGSVVVADNTLVLGRESTGYLNYVRDVNGLFQSSQEFRSYVEYSVSEDLSTFSIENAINKAKTIDSSINSLIDAVEVSIYK